MQIYNTMTRKKEPFEPITPGVVKIYACGPTVYNYFHIGNARPFIVFDALRRYLEYRGFDVTFVQNFTDIDDKMIFKANSMGISVAELADRFIAEYYKDADALGIERATVNPRATDHIGDIIALIETLIANGHAYATESGDVYYAAKSFPDYGKLSGQPLEDLEAGARIETGAIKRDDADFALWKAQKPGEPAWESPWGMGRPGWHIECSAMSMKYLGESFDIHAGGYDLIFPHHENEIAQSEGATGQPFAKYWMHNGYINIDNQKMSKSAGNFFTVRDISEQYDLSAIRLFILSAQYRHPVNFSRELVEQATSALERLKNARARLADAVETGTDGPTDETFLSSIEEAKAGFIAAMDDDLNTADAIGQVFELVRASNAHFNEKRAKADAKAALAILDELTGVLGISTASELVEIPQRVLDLVAERAQAKADKNWPRADAIREEVAELGYAIEDSKEGPKVKKLEMQNHGS